MIADESVNKNLVLAIREAGFTVYSIAEECAGMSDEDIALMSLTPPRVIISEDKDFGELVYHQKVSVIGVILLRYAPSEVDIVKTRILSFLFEYENRLKGKFTVITITKPELEYYNDTDAIHPI